LKTDPAVRGSRKNRHGCDKCSVDRIDTSKRTKKTVDWIDKDGLSLEACREAQETKEERRLDGRAEGCHWDDNHNNKRETATPSVKKCVNK